MYERTDSSPPPKFELLAVIHRVPGRGGEQVDAEAIWDGEQWTRRKDGAVVQKDYYYLWRRLET